MDEKRVKEIVREVIRDELSVSPSFCGPKNRFHAHKNTGLANTIFNTNSGKIEIGEWSFFGHNCCVITGTHDVNKTGKERMKRWPKEEINNIKIGKGVWIGSNATILGPCTIGDNSIIAAGSVLIPGLYESNSMYAGVPAVLKKKIN